MTKPSVYVETSVVGYATSRPSRDLVVAARQQISSDWFAHRASTCELFVSQLVAGEASGGDHDAARERMAFLQGIARLRVTDAAGELAARIVESGAVPRTAAEDALVDEVRRRRQAHAESLGFDLKRITEDLQRQEKESGVPVVDRTPRKPQVVPSRSSA